MFQQGDPAAALPQMPFSKAKSFPPTASVPTSAPTRGQQGLSHEAALFGFEQQPGEERAGAS